MFTESNREISFVIERYLGVLSEAQNGWKKELNLVSWNGKPAKLDIREWSPDHQKMAKGITLNPKEARILQWNLYRWLTGHGKQQETPAEAPAGVPAEVSADAPASAENMMVEPETGEILEAPAEAPVFEGFSELPAGEVPAEEVPAEEVFCCPQEAW